MLVIEFKKWWTCLTYVICGGKSTVGSPNLPASIPKALKGLLERKVSYRELWWVKGIGSYWRCHFVNKMSVWRKKLVMLCYQVLLI
jgi:hypothetical protein